MFISSDPKRAVQLYMKVARDTSPIYTLPEFSQSITLKAAAPTKTHNYNTRPSKAIKTLDLEMAAQDDDTFDPLPIDLPGPRLPEENADIFCSSCLGLASTEDDPLIACESFDCNEGCHLSCFQDRVSGVFDQQFLCPTCRRYKTCAVCDGSCDPLVPGKKDLITCALCHTQAHPICWNVTEVEKVTSDFLCMGCCCSRCNAATLENACSDPTTRCQKCGKGFHLKCDRPGDIGVIPESYVCLGCMSESHDPMIERDSQVSRDAPEQNSCSRGLPRLPMAKYTRDLSTLAALRDSHKDSLLYFALDLHLFKKASMQDNWWTKLLYALELAYPQSEVLQTIKDISIPRNLNRVLSQKVPCDIVVTLLRFECKGFRFECKFARRPIRDIVTQLLLSPKNGHSGPFIDFASLKEDEFCPAAPLPFKFIQKTLNKVEDKSASDLFVFVRMNHDGSGSNFSSFHPVQFTLMNHCAEAIAYSFETAVAIGGFFPIVSTMRVLELESNQYIPLSKISKEKAQRTALKNKALGGLQQLGMRELIQDFAKEYKGFPLLYENKVWNVRPLLICDSLDMHERRMAQNLPSIPAYHCCMCYNKNRDGFDLSPIENLLRASKVNISLGVRNFASTSLLRRLIASFDGDGNSNMEPTKQRAALRQLVGIAKSDKLHPFLNAKGQSILPTLSDASEVMPLCILHVLTGPIEKHHEYLQAIYGVNYLSELSACGDTTFTNSRVKTMHLDDIKIHDGYLMSVVLARAKLAFVSQRRTGNVRSVIQTKKEWAAKFSQEEIEEKLTGHARLIHAFNFLVLVAKDEGPGEILDEVRLAQEIYKRELEQIRQDLKDCGLLDADSCETAKQHAISEHFWDEVVKWGSLRNVATYVNENQNPRIKATLANTGFRVHDQAHQVLTRMYHQALFSELDVSQSNSALVSTRDPWVPVDCYQVHRWKESAPRTMNDALSSNVHNILPRLPAGRLFLNVENIKKRVFDMIGPTLAFGNAISCSIRCERRNVAIKSSIAFQVPREHVKPLSAVSFLTSVEQLRECRAPGCRLHNPRVVLFPPLFRAKHSDFGIPLLFVEGFFGSCAVVLQLCRKDSVDSWQQSVIDSYSFGDHGQAELRLELVPIHAIRDYHEVVVRGDQIFVLRAGSRMFGHLT